jgi:hypothetical protein
MEALALWVIERSADFPKRHKFTLGERWVEANLRVVECLLEATFQKDKRASLLGASRGLVRARVLARLGHGVGALAPKQWTYFDRESLEVGRMVGGWLRSASGSARMRTGPDHLGAQDVNEAVAFGPSASSRGEEGQAPTG